MSDIPEAIVEQAGRVIENHAYRHRISNSPYGHVCPSECLARAVLSAAYPSLRHHLAATIAAGLEDGVCPYCTVGSHEACTDDGRSRACECARSSHGPNGVGVV